MRSAPSSLAPYFRSDAHASILAQILLSPEELSLSDVSSAAGVPLTTVQREVARLAQAGVLSTRKLGNTRLVQANPDYPLLAPLREIVAATYGPQPVIYEIFANVENAQLVAIFGSWAARALGEPGPMPHDIDVVVVGEVDEMDVDQLAVDAGRAIGRDVNPVAITPERWHANTDGFVTDLRSRPLVVLHESSP